MAKTPFDSFRRVNRGPLVQKIGQGYKSQDTKSKNTYGPLVQKVLNPEKNHGYDLLRIQNSAIFYYHVTFRLTVAQ